MTDSLLEELAKKEPATLNWVVQSGKQLSMESGNAFVTDAGYFRHFLDKTSNYFRGLSFKIFNPKKLDVKLAQTYIDSLTYDKSRSVDITVPAGFIGDGFDFTDAIMFVSKEIASLPVTLKQTIKVLSVLLNEPDRLEAQSGIQKLQGELALVDEKYFEDLKYFFRNQSRTTLRFGDVFENNKMYPMVIDRLNKLNAIIAPVDYVQIKQQINRAADLASKLNTQLEHDTNTQLSGSVAGQLSELFYRLGVTATTAAVAIDAMQQMTEAMSQNLSNLKPEQTAA